MQVYFWSLCSLLLVYLFTVAPMLHCPNNYSSVLSLRGGTDLSWFSQYILIFQYILISPPPPSFTETQLTYNIVLVEGVQHNDLMYVTFWVLKQKPLHSRKPLSPCLLYTSDAADEVCRV